MDESRFGRGAGYFAAVTGVALITTLIELIPDANHIANISLLYLVVVMGTAHRYGRGPAVAASLLAVLSFDWFFVAPRHTFTVNNPAEWLALAIFLAVAVAISQLTQNLQLRANQARQREHEMAALSQASWAVASQVSHEGALAEVLRQIINVTGSTAAAIVTSGHDAKLTPVAALRPAGSPAPDADEAAARDVLMQGDEVVVPSQYGCAWYFPLRLEQRVLGVLYLCRNGSQPLAPEERRVIEMLANHVTVALERDRLARAEAQTSALIEADKLKTALLGMVSHDFRSPLAAIKASVTGLMQEDGQPWEAAAQRELLHGIDQETDRLNGMVGNVLAFSRLQAGAWRPQCEQVALSEVVGAVLDAFGPDDNRRIVVTVPADLPEVDVDSVQMVQVLHNLIENALKYSPRDSTVELGAWDDGASMVLEVRDSGYGLPSHEAERIFEPFYRAARWRESSLPGSGIGLAICRGVVEAHGGRLEAANRRAGGTVFRMTLPRR